MSLVSVLRPGISSSMTVCAILVLLLSVHIERISSSKASGSPAPGEAEKEVDDDEDDEEEEEPEVKTQPHVKPPHSKSGSPKERVVIVPGHPPRVVSGKVASKGPASAEQEEEEQEEEHLDPEEFEGFESKAASSSPVSPEAKMAEKPAANAKPIVPKKRERELSDFYPEMLAVLGLIVYAINYVYGREKNRHLAEQWFQSCIDVLEANFAMVGFDDGRRLSREGAGQFKLYCSGRINCESLMITLNLRPRHDLISLLWEQVQSSVQTGLEDTVTLEVSMGSTPETGGQMEGFVLAVLPKGDETTARSECRDLENKIVVRKWKTGLHDSLVCMSDEEEVAREMLPDSLVRTLNEHRQYLKLLHVSDRMVVGPAIARRGQPVQACVKVVLFLQPFDRRSTKDGSPRTLQDKLRVGEELISVALRYIDKCATYQLSAAAKERMKKLHVQLAEYEFKKTRSKREADAQQRKLDKLKKEKEALESMSPELAAKYEEKLLKKQRKTTGPIKAIKIK